MHRQKELLRFVSKDAVGIEIAPYFNPLASKADGYKCLIIDIFDEDQLRANAKSDPNIPDARVSEIESVDFVGDASRLDELLRGRPEFGACDYVISSHNFEHLPNPIRFLRGCAEVMRPGGVLSMAIPDYRACFDHFRFPTRLSDWISAYHEDRRKPALQTVLDAKLGTSMYSDKNGVARPGFALGSARLERFRFGHNLPRIYEQYLDKPEHYIDTHCSVTCPEIFHLLVNDLIHIGLVNFEILSISKTNGIEYFVHLRKPAQEIVPDQTEYKAKRPRLLNEARLAIGNGNDSRLHSWLMNAIHDDWARRLLGLKSYLVNSG
ncbi:MAG: methyltransferase domain-containing protein [Pseudomonadota bacterium]